jgi:hypothetical protein
VRALNIHNLPPHLKQTYVTLHELATQSMNWINRYLPFFSPYRGNIIDYTALQAFSELSLVYTYLHNWKHLKLTNTLPTWYTFLTKHLENHSYAKMVRTNPLFSFHYLFPYLMLRSSHYRFSYYEETLNTLCRFGYLYAGETVPELYFERDFVYWKANYCKAPNWLHLYEQTSLGNRFNSLSINEDHAYAATHTLFYVTDFGNQSFPWLLREHERLAAILEMFLLHYLRVGHWDLVGELLINLHSLGKNGSTIYKEAAAGFQNAWKNNGAVPFQQGISYFKKTLHPEETFTMYYHTTLVGILYCATAMNALIKQAAAGNACKT